MSEYHIPVLAEESINLLDINPKGTYVDLTFGGGGHSRMILERLGPKGRLCAFDQDADAASNAPADKRFTFIASNFRFMRSQLRYAGLTQVDGILADLGVSSHHFDTPERGFSFRTDGPLDMRMNRSGGRTAADVVNSYSREELTSLLRRWGELHNAYKLAGHICSYRQEKYIGSVRDLLDAVASAVPQHETAKVLPKLFQALRIEINGEMEALKMMLEQSYKTLRTGGRLVVISYHSLEDRLVKNFFKSGNFDGKPEKDFFGNPSTPFDLITRKALTPAEDEIAVNPRSRSAKLRAAEKI